MAVLKAADVEPARLCFVQCAQHLRESAASVDDDLSSSSAQDRKSHRSNNSGTVPAPDFGSSHDDHARPPAQQLTDLVPQPAPSRQIVGMAIRYTLYVLDKVAHGPGVELRVAPFAAVKILPGPKSDPHNLTPPDVIELEPWVWLRLASGLTSWAEEKAAGHITAVGERDDLSRLLPIEA